MQQSNHPSRRPASYFPIPRPRPASDDPQRIDDPQLIDDLIEDARQARFRNPREAEGITRRALSLAEARGYPSGIVQCRIQLSKYHLDNGDPAAAAEELRIAEELAERHTIPSRVRTSLTYQHGMSAGAACDHRAAVDLFRAAAEQAARDGDRQMRTSALLQLGSSHNQSGASRSAVATLTEAIALARDAGDEGSLGVAHMYLSDIYFEAKNIDASLEHVERAIESFQRCDRPMFLATAHMKAGMALMSVSLDRAETHLLAGLEVIGGLDVPNLQCVPLALLADIAAIRRDHERFLELAGRAGELLPRVGDIGYRAFARRALGRAHENVGDYRMALHHNLEAEEILRALDGPSEQLHLLYTRISECYRLLDEPEKSIAYATRAVNALCALVAVGASDALTDMKPALEIPTRLSPGTPSTADPEPAGEQGAPRHFDHRYMAELAREFPSLTSMELKICSLLRLNMSCKEISEILIISVRTAETHRTNIRKKLNIPAGISLFAFLSSRCAT